ncbi:MAG: STAS domain-containing protein [Gemmatimonadales bacterium]
MAPDSPSPTRMVEMEPGARSITAPDDLGLETRASFREAAFAALARLPDGGVLRVDLGATRRVDSAGLSALMLVQRRAADRSQRVVLHAASDEFRYLLTLTQLADLFELEPGTP